jgi:ABC-2 type transport system permease protein
MKEILFLTKVSLMNTFNLHGLNPRNFRTNRDKAKPFIFILVLIALAPTYGYYVTFLQQLGKSLLMLNQELYFSTLAHYMASSMVFFFGLLYVLSYYYFSRDTEMLIPLPLKGRTIVVSKFITILVYEYLLLAIFLIPILVINKSLVGGSMFVYALKSILTLLLTPVIPLSLASILVIILMRTTNIKGRKDLIRLVSMFLFIFIILGIQIVIQRSMTNIPPGQEQEFMATLFNDNKALIDMIGRYFPVSKWTSISLSNSGIVALFDFLKIVAANMVAFVLMIAVSEKIYLGGIIGGKEAQAKKKKLTSKELEEASGRVSKNYIAIFKADMITLLKTPIYMFNCVSIVILIPFILLVMPYLTGSGGDMAELGTYYSMFENYFIFAMAGGFMFFAALNPTAPSTFSREGKTFWITRIIPVSTRDHIIGKGLSPMLLQLLTIIIVSIGIRFYIPVKTAALLTSAVLGIAGSVPLVLAGLAVDISRPLLDWDNPQRAVKHNLNVLLSMGIGSLVTLGLGLLTWLMLKNGISSMLIMALDLAIIVVLAVLSFKLLTNRMEVQLREME